MREFDIVIRAGHLLTMSEKGPFVLQDQLIGIEKSKIKVVEPFKEGSWKASRFIDATGAAVMPGLINAHGHLPMTLFRGLADDLPFAKWLNEYILPLEGRLVSPEMVKLGTELACLESILSGTTTLYDMYYFEDHIAEVCDESGIRAILGETVIDFPVPDDKNKDGAEYKILDRMVERYKNHERIYPMISPHAPYTCSDDRLKKAAAYAKKHEIPLGIHVAETKGEVDGSIQQYKKTPTKRLYDLGVLEAFTIMAHGVHLTDDDISIIKKTKSTVVHNPESNMKLGAGTAPIKKLIDAGVVVGLGTDGAASNNDLSLFKEMDVAAKLQKNSHNDNTAMTAQHALKMATIWGAHSLGLGKVTGSIEVGKYADIAIVNLDKHPHMWPLHDVASQLVYSANGSEVDTVICHGKVLLDKRQPQSIDSARLLGRIKEYRSKNNF